VKIKAAAAVTVAALVCILVPPATATGATNSDARVDMVVLEAPASVAGVPTSQLILQLDDPAATDALEAELEDTFGPLDVTRDAGTLHAIVPGTAVEVSPGAVATAPAAPGEGDVGAPDTLLAGYYPIYCNSSHRFTDSNGTYSVQRACGSKLAPWGFRFSTAIQAICVSYTVDEHGMKWWKNGVYWSTNSRHNNMGCGYQFHGTYNPVPKGSKVDYEDIFTFRHNINGGGNATITISGKLDFRGAL